MKLCQKCSQIKPFEDFHKRPGAKDGHQYWCKVCIAIYNHENRHRRIEYNRKYWKKKSTLERAKKRQQQRRKEKNAKDKARTKLQNAVQRGAVVKPTICSHCNKEFPVEQIQGHHLDYAFPFKVIWLCFKCHIDLYHPYESKYFDHNNINKSKSLSYSK